MLIHVFQCVDKLKDGVVLDLIDDEEFAGNAVRLFQRIDLLVADHDFQFQ